MPLVGDPERTNLPRRGHSSLWTRKEKKCIAMPVPGFPRHPGSPGPRLMLDEIREKIGEEIEQLAHELNILIPERIEKAVELGDLRENAEYKSALERQQFIQVRIGHLTHRLSELSKIDVDAMPVDRVGFGSRVEIHDLVSDEVSNVTIVAGDFMERTREAIIEGARTGNFGDGVIFVVELGECYRIRTGESGGPAVG